MKPLEAIRCTQPACRCECYAPGKQSLRYCDTCNHGWVSHALDKLGPNHSMNIGLQVEVVQPNIVFDIASLMLYGAHATPVRLKILLDRLFSVLQHEEVLQILHGFGWTYEDYARGYILQDSVGRVLDKWCVATHEEELVILQQFLRFGETKTTAQEILLQDTKDHHEFLVKQTPAAESDIKKFIERSNSFRKNYIKSYESTRQLFATRPVPFIPLANRIMQSPLEPPSYISNREPHVLSMSRTSITTSTPLRTSPLNCIQMVQHVDTRKEQPSPVMNLSLGGVDTYRSPKCNSPQNLSKASSASPSHQTMQPYQPQQPQGLDEVDGSDPYISGSEEDEEVLDFSNKDSPNSPTDGDKKSKHARKSTNPIKRQWTPPANFGSTFVGPNGKKRVLCTACSKTFCDKGALKIHYSAVHLKEMHKCTVEGCNMMFSSRRSRNRHSANPNPKLHMPQKRKDELDLSEEVDLTKMNGSFISVASTTPTKYSTSSSPDLSVNSSEVLTLLDSQPLRPDSNFFNDMSSQLPFLAPPEKRIKMDDEQPRDLRIFNMSKSHDEKPFDLRKKLDDELKLEIDLDKCCDENEQVVNGEKEIDAIGIKTNKEWGIKGGKRRKNTVPTRSAQNGESIATRQDNAGDKISEGKLSLNLNNDGSLDYNGRSYLDARKNGENSLQECAVESKRDFIYECTNVQAQVPELQDARSFYSQENMNDKNEARNLLKIVSLWVDKRSSNTTNVSKDVLENKALQESDEDFTTDKESNTWQVSDAGVDVSECDSSEENESLPSNDGIQVHPSDIHVDKEHPLKCKVCGKIFKNSFTVKIHFQNVHLKVMNPCTGNGSSKTFPSKRSHGHHSSNLNLPQFELARDVNAEKEKDNTLRHDMLNKLYGHDLNSDCVLLNNGADVENNESVNNNIEKLKRGHIKGSFHVINSGTVASVSASNPLKLTIQQGLNGLINKPSSTESEAIKDESENESESMDKNVHLDNGTLKVQSQVCSIKHTNSAMMQDNGISHHENALSPPVPVSNKTVSPNRVCSRLPSRNGMTTRRLTSL